MPRPHGFAAIRAARIATVVSAPLQPLQHRQQSITLGLYEFQHCERFEVRGFLVVMRTLDSVKFFFKTIDLMLQQLLPRTFRMIAGTVW